MSDAKAVAEKTSVETGEAASESSVSKKKSKLPLILMILLPLLTLAIGGAAAYFMGFLSFGHKEKTEQTSADKKEGDKKEGGHEAKAGSEHSEAKPGDAPVDSKEHPKTSIFHQLPEMMINLNAEGNKISYLKLQVSLEIDDPKSVEALQKLLPRIQDTIQVYIRELKVADLRSSIGVEKLRQELLKRIQLIAKDVKIFDILFPQMLTQ